MRTSAVVPVFDPRLATCRTIILRMNEVVDLLPISHAPECVDQYRRDMEKGDSFPPVAVIRLGPYHLLADGHKRLSAYRQLGHDRLVVELWPLRHWLRDQWRQVRGNARKNLRIVSTSVSDPAAAWRLLLTTLRHWRRVATSLVARAAGRVR